MSTQVFKEIFAEKYDGVASPLDLKMGAITDGLNVRKVSGLGGWKVRKGCTIHNTTSIASASSVRSLHQYTHPRNLDYHFLAQANSNLYDSTNDPPAAGTTFGSSVCSSGVGATPGFSDAVGEHWFYADGNPPLTWGGDTPFPIGFLAWDNSAGAKVDYTRMVTDQRTSTVGLILGATGDYALVGAAEFTHSIILDLSAAVNTAASTLTIGAWRAGAWATVSSMSDGTATTGGTKTLGQDGTISWTRSTSDTMSIHNGIMAYWYKMSFSQALSASVGVIKAQVVSSVTPMTNKWDGVPNLIAGARFFDQSVGLYNEILGKVGNESSAMYLQLQAATTSDFIYVKTSSPATAFALAVAEGYTQVSGSANIDLVEHWDGDSWETVGTLTDETLNSGAAFSFAQTGWVLWNGVAITSYRRTFSGDQVPGYWYRISWDAALTNTDIRLYYIAYAPIPETLPAYDGCIEFKDRLILWGDPEYPNRLRYSAAGRPDCFVGPDSGYTEPFGDMRKILCCIRFFNELVIFKKNSVWMLEGYGGLTFGRVRITDEVGLSSPKTARPAEGGSPEMHTNESLSVILWQDVDGVYAFDGRKPKKISQPVDQYFNPEFSTTCISAADIDALGAYVDRINNEYHLLLPSGGELVYNFLRDEWCPPWDRQIDLTCGLTLRGTDDRLYTYGASAGGLVMRLENDTSDKTTANADQAISHYITTRAICAQPDKSETFEFTMRRLWAGVKARSAGSITTTYFKDSATSGTAMATPAAMSMIATGKNFALPRLDGDVEGCISIQFKFALATIDHEMEIHSLLYEMESRGIRVD